MQTMDNLMNGAYRLVYMTPEFASSDDSKIEIDSFYSSFYMKLPLNLFLYNF